MKRFIGVGKGKEPPPTLGETENRLEKRADVIGEKVKKIDKQLIEIKQQMKRMKPGAAQNQMKQRAMQLLRQRKQYQGQQDNMRNQAFNIANTSMTIDSLKDTKETVNAMKAANKEMKKFYKKEININDVEDMHDEMEDNMELANEIQEVMGRSYGMPDELDECDLEDELDALESEWDMEDETEDPSYLPTVPVNDPTMQGDNPTTEKDDDEFAKLEANMTV